MADIMDQDIENIIRLLDGKTEAGVSRICLDVKEADESGIKKEKYHHGRCNVGSPWADGSVGNFGEC